MIVMAIPTCGPPVSSPERISYLITLINIPLSTLSLKLTPLSVASSSSRLQARDNFVKPAQEIPVSAPSRYQFARAVCLAWKDQ